jgi:hypothetical protein
MPTPFSDKVGQIFGYWAVIGFAGRDKFNATVWNCKCICGVEKEIKVGSLMKGKSKSCGCKRNELFSLSATKHGMAKTPTYKSWHAMIQRTQGKGGHQSYVDRGFTVCEQWMKFENFVSDMGIRPAGKTLDRIDNTKGYSKENCRWATPVEQANNKDTTRYVVVDGERMPIMYACKKYNIGISCARNRLRRGKSDQETFKPLAQPKHEHSVSLDLQDQ